MSKLATNDQDMPMQAPLVEGSPNGPGQNDVQHKAPSPARSPTTKMKKKKSVVSKRTTRNTMASTATMPRTSQGSNTGEMLDISQIDTSHLSAEQKEKFELAMMMGDAWGSVQNKVEKNAEKHRDHIKQLTNNSETYDKVVDTIHNSKTSKKLNNSNSLKHGDFNQLQRNSVPTQSRPLKPITSPTVKRSKRAYLNPGPVLATKEKRKVTKTIKTTKKFRDGARSPPNKNRSPLVRTIQPQINDHKIKKRVQNFEVK